MPRVLRWLLFSVAISLVPFAATALRIKTGGGQLNLQDFTINGEVLILAAALAASGLGELAGNNLRHRNLGIVSGFGCTAIVMVSSIWYGSGPPIDQTFFAFGSLAMLLCATLIGVLCIWISE